MSEQDKRPVFEAEIPDELPMEKELRRREEEARVQNRNDQAALQPAEKPDQTGAGEPQTTPLEPEKQGETGGP